MTRVRIRIDPTLRIGRRMTSALFEDCNVMPRPLEAVTVYDTTTRQEAPAIVEWLDYQTSTVFLRVAWEKFAVPHAESFTHSAVDDDAAPRLP